jgi:type IV secretion system protein VirD4
LTAGEVLQLPQDDALLLISGTPPIRARKLRYFKDDNFLARCLPAPALTDGGFAEAPARSDEWSGRTRATDVRLEKAWSEGATTFADDEDRPKLRKLPKRRAQPDHHLDLPLFAALALDPEPEVDLAPPADDGNGTILTFARGLKLS